MSEVERYLGEIGPAEDIDPREYRHNTDASGEIVGEWVSEGWSEDDGGLPVFTAASAETIDNELVNMRAVEGEMRVRIAAILTEASDRRFYGDGSLERTCRENNVRYSTARNMVAAYRRLRSIENVHRRTISAAVRSGEMYWSKLEIVAPVADDDTYVGLLEETNERGWPIPNSELRRRVHEIVGGYPVGVGDVVNGDELGEEMSRWERNYGFRDKSFSRFHRDLADDLSYMDLDGVEFCSRSKEPLALYESCYFTAGYKPTTVMRKMAQAADIPAYLIRHSRTDPQIYMCECCDEPYAKGVLCEPISVQEIYPVQRPAVRMTRQELVEFITKIHDECECSPCVRSRARTR